MRDIDDGVQTQLESPARTDLILCFFTITNPADSPPIYLVCEEYGNISWANNGPINYYLDGNLHLGFPFRFTRLTDDDRSARTVVVLPGFDRRIVQWFKDMTDPARLRADCYSSAAWVGASLDMDNARTPLTTPKRVYLADKLWLRNVSVTGSEITAELGGYDYTQEPLGYRTTKSLTPDLYR